MIMFTLHQDSTISEIQEALECDGYPHNKAMARQVKRAHAKGCLVWTVDRLTSTQANNRFDYRPMESGS